MQVRIEGPDGTSTELEVKDTTRNERQRYVSTRFELGGGSAVYITIATCTSEQKNHTDPGPGYQIEVHTDGPHMRVEWRAHAMTREQWEAFKRAGDAVWNQWETYFGAKILREGSPGSGRFA